MKCDICESVIDVRMIEQRIRWGAAVRHGIGTGYSRRPIPWCAACRKTRGRHSFRYAKMEQYQGTDWAKP